MSAKKPRPADPALWPLRDKRSLIARNLRMKLAASPGIPANVLAVAAADLCLLWLGDDDPDQGHYERSHYAKMATVVAVSLGQHRHQADGKIPKVEELYLPSLTIKADSKRPGIEAVREARRWLVERGVIEFKKMDSKRWLVTYDWYKLMDLPSVFDADERSAPDERPRCQHCNNLIAAARITRKYCSRACQQQAYRDRCDGKSEVTEPVIRDGKSEVCVTVNPTSCDGKSTSNSTDVLILGTATPILKPASAETAQGAEPALAAGLQGEELAGAGRFPAGVDLPAESVQAPVLAAKQLPAEEDKPVNIWQHHDEHPAHFYSYRWCPTSCRRYQKPTCDRHTNWAHFESSDPHCKDWSDRSAESRAKHPAPKRPEVSAEPAAARRRVVRRPAGQELTSVARVRHDEDQPAEQAEAQ